MRGVSVNARHYGKIPVINHISRRCARVCSLLLSAITLVLFPQASSAYAVPITSPGPLTSIDISSQLNCSVHHVGDGAPEWYAGNACGTFIALNGTLYGPSSVPAGGNASPRTPYSQVSQSGVTGSGTAADPYQVVTVVNAGTGVTLTQTDSYVVGRESYDTRVTVQNNSGQQRVGNIYAAGDCFLQNSDFGYGRVIGTAPACAATPDPGSRIEGLLPRTGGNAYVEAHYWEVWSQIGTQQPFSNTCRCNELIDNGVGISWPVNITNGGSATYQWSTIFSPTGTLPLVTKATANNSTSEAGAGNGYTVTVENPNTSTATVNSISVELPQGFSYRAGTTTGITTSDPTVSGRTLTWQGPFTLAAGATATIKFGVTVSTTPGTYTIDVNASSPDTEVTPAIDVAPVTVVAPPAITSPADGSTINDSTPTFTGTGGNRDAIAVTDETGAIICEATVDAGGHWSCTATTAIPDGRHTFRPTATDPNGAKTTGNAVTITISTAPTTPEPPTITTPADGSVVKGCRKPMGSDVERTGSSCVLRFTGTGRTGDRITVSEGKDVICSANVDASGEWTCTARVPSRVGKHTFIAIATDSNGDTARSGPVTVTIEPRLDSHEEQPHKPHGKDERRYGR